MPSPTSILPFLAGTSLLLLTLPLTRSVQQAQDEYLAYQQQRRERKRPELRAVREELESRNERVEKQITVVTARSGRGGERRSSGVGDGGMTGQGAWLDWVDFE